MIHSDASAPSSASSGQASDPSAAAAQPWPDDDDGDEFWLHHPLPEQASLCPNYDLKRVEQKVPKLATEGKMVKAKQLLCGLQAYMDCLKKYLS